MNYLDNDDEVIVLLSQSARIGGETVLNHDITYRELISSGGLQMISDFELRESLDAYFLDVSRVQNLRAQMETRLGERIAALTGRLSRDLEYEFDLLSDSTKSRIISDLTKGSESIEAARTLSSQTVFFVDRLNRLLDLNSQLQNEMQ